MATGAPPPLLSDSDDDYELIDRSVTPNSRSKESLASADGSKANGRSVTSISDAEGKRVLVDESETSEMVRRIQEIVHERRLRESSNDKGQFSSVIKILGFVCFLIAIVYDTFAITAANSEQHHGMKVVELFPLRTITISSSPGSMLGFTVRNAWVCAVAKGGAANRHSDLRVGDRIVSVNEVDVSGYTHNALVDLIRKAVSSGTVRLVVRHDPQWAESIEDLLQLELEGTVEEEARNAEIARLTDLVEYFKQWMLEKQKKRNEERGESELEQWLEVQKLYREINGLADLLKKSEVKQRKDMERKQQEIESIKELSHWWNVTYEAYPIPDWFSRKQGWA